MRKIVRGVTAMLCALGMAPYPAHACSVADVSIADIKWGKHASLLANGEMLDFAHLTAALANSCEKPVSVLFRLDFGGPNGIAGRAYDFLVAIGPGETKTITRDDKIDSTTSLATLKALTVTDLNSEADKEAADRVAPPAPRTPWFMTLNISPTECVDATSPRVDPHGYGFFTPAAFIKLNRDAGLRVTLIDKNDIVHVIVQEKDGKLTEYVFYRTLNACQKDVGYMKDSAPTGTDLEKYR